MKGDQMHVKGDEVLRNYVLSLLWVWSFLYRYLKQQPSAAFSLLVERHKFMCEHGKMEPY